MKNPEGPLGDFLADCGQRLDHALERWMPQVTTHPARLHTAMRYAALDGGKRIRPALVYASGRACGAPPDHLDSPASAIELIHAYSLVHDDLPCMDDDDLRRGKPSCHRAFDEATAILAGDALQSLAFYILTHDRSDGMDPATRLRMVATLALAAGSRGMAGGQAIDLAATGNHLNIAELEDMHIHKTGALIRASVMLGADCSNNADDTRRNRLDHYAKCMGLAFQIRDDILDVEGETGTLGKQAGADASQDKATYPSLMGLDAARERARELHQDAMDSLGDFGTEADPLRWISTYIVERER